MIESIIRNSPPTPIFSKQSTRAPLYRVGANDAVTTGVMVDFGDGNGSSTLLVAGTTDAILKIHLRSATFAHQYINFGAFAAKVRLCCRAADVLNNGGADIVMESIVVISPGYVEGLNGPGT